ncbi:hypothetical protein PMZ80_002728 [Knufia obscura]|uniref:SHSP domain-containing protein n=1 Tax=Knufia obscura TaxID=1635080 RepID=A0ABR0RY52_9EURO|nr:hypothetical protein PMZ80_002728 [Knufia obscura]
MPPVYYLNPPSNPFWDFVSSLEDHPLFAGPPSQPHRHHGPPSSPPRSSPAGVPPARPAQPEMSETARGKQPTVEDPPETDPSTAQPNPVQGGRRDMPFRGRGRFASAFDGEAENKTAEPKTTEREIPFRGRGRFARAFEGEDTEGRHGRRGHPCRRGRAGWGGPPPFMFGHPFFARGPWAPEGTEGNEHRGPPGPPGPPHHHPHGPPPHARGPHGPHHRPSPPRGPRPEFNLGDFLNKLGDRLGVDLSNAAEGLGLTADRFTAGRTSQEVNFEPRADIFENKDLYTIHLSLPGAKKSDIGVDYDGEHSMLRITGVVHRPDVDEQMLKELVVDGRKRETGVFEKAIRLGTKRDPASIDVAGISAKMTDGVLVVKIPKVEKVHQKREVPITTDPLAEGQADYEDEYSEKPVLFDADEQASVAATETTDAPKREEISLIDMKNHEVRPEPNDEEASPAEAPEPQPKHHEAEQDKEGVKTSTSGEQLPAYSAEDDHEEDDWEKFSDASGEGEYIKINVD